MLPPFNEDTDWSSPRDAARTVLLLALFAPVLVAAKAVEIWDRLTGRSHR